MLDEDQKRQIFEALVEQERIARGSSSIPTTKHSEPAQRLVRTEDLYNSQPWWCYPKYSSPQPSVRDWEASAKNRSRFAWAIIAVCVLVAIIATALPPSFDPGMLIGFSVLSALLAAWQHDVASHEFRRLATMTDEHTPITP